MRVEAWLKDSFGQFNKTLQESIKRQFDEEAFAQNPDYDKLARIGSLIDNPQLEKELLEAQEEVARLVINLLSIYGVENTEIATDAPVQLYTPPPLLPSFVPRIEPPKEILVQQTLQTPEIHLERREMEPAVEELIQKGEPQQIILRLQNAQSLQERKDILSTALFTLGVSAKDMSSQSFHKRIKTLFSLDDTRDPVGNFSHETMLGILEEWLESEDPTKSEMAVYLFDHLSTATLEHMLGRPNLETCSPNRMVIYLRNSAFKLSVIPEHEQIDENEFSDYERIEDPEGVEEVIENILERENETPGYLDDVIEIMRSQGYLEACGRHTDTSGSYVQNAIRELAAGGSESAYFFLRSAWLDYLV